MADIALVHLALDSTAVKSGADQSVKALKSVETSMDSTVKHAENANKKLGASASKTAAEMTKVTAEAGKMGGALNHLGGNVGSVTTQLGPLGNALDAVQTYIAKFGLAGGLAASAVAGLTAIAGALTALTISGVGVSDSMGDIAESTGLSLDAVQRLAAAASLSGEDMGIIEKAFKTYTSAVIEAQDPTSKAAKAFKALGIDSKVAGDDIEKSFLDSIVQLKKFRETAVGSEASTLLFSKGVFALTRTADNLGITLKSSRKELEDSFIVATEAGVIAGGRLDAQMNKLNTTWTVFTQNLAATNVGTIIETSLSGGISALGALLHMLQEIEKNPYAKAVLLGVGLNVVGPIAFAGGKSKPVDRAKLLEPGPAIASRGDAPFTKKKGLGLGDYIPPAGAAAKAAKGKSDAEKAEEEFQKARLAAAREGSKLMVDQFDKDIAELEKLYGGLMEAHKTSVEDARVELGERVGKLAKGVPLVIPGAPPGVGGTTIPGELQPKGPPADKIRTEQQAALDAEFSAIFDNFLFSVLTAQKSLGEAFGDLALGIVDTFAIEFSKAMREAFITPIIKGLTDLLVSGLKSILASVQGQLTGGGGTGFWAGLLGSILGGAASGLGGAKVGTPSLAHIRALGGARYFAEGGTLYPGKFGIVGERGPELIFAASQPMHIAPLTGGGAGSTTTINFAITTPNGQIDRRTQDQMATQVYNAVQRAQRNQGSR